MIRPHVDVGGTIGAYILNKEGSTLYHFKIDREVLVYDIRTAEWSPPESTEGAFLSMVLDSDMDQIVKMSYSGTDALVRWDLKAHDPTTNKASVESENIPEQVLGGMKVYSSARRSLFFLHTEGPTTLYEYNIASDAWTTVV